MFRYVFLCTLNICVFCVFVYFVYLCMRSNYQFDIAAVQVATLQHFSSSCNAYIVWVAGWVGLSCQCIAIIFIQCSEKCKQINFPRKKEISLVFIMLYHIQSCGLYLAVFPFWSAPFKAGTQLVNPPPSSFPNCLKPLSRSCLARLQSKFQLDFTLSGIRGSGGWR